MTTDHSEKHQPSAPAKSRAPDASATAASRAVSASATESFLAAVRLSSGILPAYSGSALRRSRTAGGKSWYQNMGSRLSDAHTAAENSRQAAAASAAKRAGDIAHPLPNR